MKEGRKEGGWEGGRGKADKRKARIRKEGLGRERAYKKKGGGEVKYEIVGRRSQTKRGRDTIAEGEGEKKEERGRVSE